jgi:sulfur carrier protein
MQITVNGQTTEVARDTDVTAILRALDIDAAQSGIAVAVNDTVVPRARWQSHRIEPDDTVEIVRAVQGG